LICVNCTATTNPTAGVAGQVTSLLKKGIFRGNEKLAGHLGGLRDAGVAGRPGRVAVERKSRCRKACRSARLLETGRVINHADLPFRGHELARRAVLVCYEIRSGDYSWHLLIASPATSRHAETSYHD
jgi:hypothetical protein